jgi:ankyrin repeat protein
MFLTLHIRAMVRHVIIGRASFSISHGRKVSIAMLGQMSPTSQGPVACHHALWKNREEMVELLRERLGVSVAILGQSYQKPYSHRFNTMTYLQGTGIHDFSKFSGESGESTHEHVSQFLAHLGELANRKAYRVRVFSLSLTGTTFARYTALSPNSINSWEELEQRLHEQFLRRA